MNLWIELILELIEERENERKREKCLDIDKNWNPHKTDPERNVSEIENWNK